MEHVHEHPSGGDRFRNVSRWVFFGFAAVAVYYLILEHRAHVVGFLPFVLLAACPLMHLFHHRHGHGGHIHPGGEKGSAMRSQFDPRDGAANDR